MAGEPRFGQDGAGDDLGADGHGSAASRAQRQALIDAFTRTAAERGYRQTTIDDVAAAAGMPVEIFSQHFASKSQCLSAAYDSFLQRLIVDARGAMRPGQAWPLQVKAAVNACLCFLGEAASRARFFAVEALEAGPLILARHFAAINSIALLLRDGREHYRRAADLPDPLERVLVGGAACRITASLLAEEQDGLLDLEAELVEILLTPYLGSEQARRVAASI